MLQKRGVKRYVDFEALTERGATATLDALSRGASDYVTKPSSATANSAGSAIEHFRRELIPRVKALCPHCKVAYANAADDAMNQRDQMNSLITRGARVIILDAVDGKAMSPAMMTTHARL